MNGCALSSIYFLAVFIHFYKSSLDLLNLIILDLSVQLGYFCLLCRGGLLSGSLYLNDQTVSKSRFYSPNAWGGWSSDHDVIRTTSLGETLNHLVPLSCSMDEKTEGLRSQIICSRMYNHVSKWVEGLVLPHSVAGTFKPPTDCYKMSQFFQCLPYNNQAPILLEFSSFRGFIPSYIFGTLLEMLTFSLSLSSLMHAPPPQPGIPLRPAASAPARSQLGPEEVTSCLLRVPLLSEARPCSLVVLCVRNGPSLLL